MTGSAAQDGLVSESQLRPLKYCNSKDASTFSLDEFGFTPA